MKHETKERKLTQAKGRKITPKEVKAGAAAMSSAMMKKMPGASKHRKSK